MVSNRLDELRAEATRLFETLNLPEKEKDIALSGVAKADEAELQTMITHVTEAIKLARQIVEKLVTGGPLVDALRRPE